MVLALVLAVVSGLPRRRAETGAEGPSAARAIIVDAALRPSRQELEFLDQQHPRIEADRVPGERSLVVESLGERRRRSVRGRAMRHRDAAAAVHRSVMAGVRPVEVPMIGVPAR